MTAPVLRLADAPPFISNLAVLIGTISDILHEIDREKAAPVIADIHRASSLLAIARDACVATVAAIEAGPDYHHGERP